MGVAISLSAGHIPCHFWHSEINPRKLGVHGSLTQKGHSSVPSFALSVSKVKSSTTTVRGTLMVTPSSIFVHKGLTILLCRTTYEPQITHVPSSPGIVAHMWAGSTYILFNWACSDCYWPEAISVWQFARSCSYWSDTDAGSNRCHRYGAGDREMCPGKRAQLPSLQLCQNLCFSLYWFKYWPIQPLMCTSYICFLFGFFGQAAIAFMITLKIWLGTNHWCWLNGAGWS